MNRPARIVLKILGALLALLGILTLAVLVILPSAWFQNKVRQRIVTEVERVTGGRTEIGQFRFDWKTLTAEVRMFVLHGTESSPQQPLLRADSIRVGLKIVSLMKRNIDIASLTVDKPQVNILVDAQGHTNFPTPQLQRSAKTDPIQLILDLKIKQIAINQGIVHFGDETTPLDVRGENFNSTLSYDVTGPRYRGAFDIDALHIESGKLLALGFHAHSNIVLEKAQVQFQDARLDMPKSTVEFSGQLDYLNHVRVALDVKAVGDLSELSGPLHLPQPNRGLVTFLGKATYTPADNFLISGKVTGKGLAVAQDGIEVANIGMNGVVRFGPHEITLHNLTVTALGGQFKGQADVKEFRLYSAKGVVSGLSVAQLSRATHVKGVVWNGDVSGPVEVSGTFGARANDFKAEGQLEIQPAAPGIPVSGHVEVAYGQRLQQVKFGRSHVETAASAITFDGTLGQHLDIHAQSKDLKDLLPALAMAFANPPDQLPVALSQGGTAVFDGTVDGSMAAAEVKGTLTLGKFNTAGQTFGKLTASLDANRRGIHIQSFALNQDQLVLEGSADAGLQDWKLVDSSPVSATLRLRGAQIAKLLASAGEKLPVPVDGTLSGAISVQGTFAKPAVSMQAAVEKPAIDGERFDRFRAQVRYAGEGVDVINGELTQGAAQVSIAGAYRHKGNDWNDGNLQFDVTTRGFTLEQLHNVQEYRPGVKGQFTLKLAGDATVANRKPLLNRLNGQLALQNLVIDNKPIGSLAVDASTVGTKLTVGTSGELRGSKVSGNGIFDLTGDYPGKGELEFSPMTVATIQDLVTPKGSQRLPVDGVVQGRITFSGPALKPDLMTARLEMPRLELVPAPQAVTGNVFNDRNGTANATQAKDLTLRNAGPIVVNLDTRGVHIQSLHLVGRDSNLEATGTLNFRDDKNPWDLHVTGDVNLAVLQDFQPGLVSSGKSVVNATVRGTLSQPQINGRMELKNASFYLEDVPNGIDQANGVVMFDRNRATIVDKLTAQTGGGEITLTGFVGFGTGELVYRLQGRGDNVRYRGDGVSVTANANVTLTGTSTHSLLAGTLTVVKAGFNPKADLGSLLLSSSTPISTPAAPNLFLRGLQLDIHVETTPNLQFQTSLTSDLQAEADLHVHGSAVRPVLSGLINVNQGEVQFFGNKYTINRGNIAFYNTTKIEPVLDMDLQTQVRGITVNINFSGPINKLNLSYRSDPPLQPNEIIALLAVGRAPGTTSSLASSQTVTQNSLATSTDSLLGQAIAAPVSSRLQRFFGVSRLKIDPLLTGVNATPQARLTLEQQISKDITLTYVTNLSEANQQLVRVEWDINRNWSAVAIREENGVFGIDFLYKKRFK